MSPVRVGICGIGFMGASHFRMHRANPKSKIVAIAELDSRKRAGDWSAIGGNIGDKSGRVDLSGVAAYRSYEALIADPRVDLVDICLPTFLHADAAVKALKAGKHVLCEKPLSTSVKECDAVLAAAKKSKGKFMNALCMRFWPEWAWIKEVVVDGRKYGKVLSATFQRFSATPRWSWQGWMLDGKKGGSAAYDLHVHDADYVQFLFGKVRGVTSRGVRGKVSKGGWDHIDTFYDVAGCPHVRAEGGFAFEKGWGFWWQAHILCEKATVFLTLRPAAETKIFHKDGSTEVLKLKPVKYRPDGWAAEIDYLLDCILKNKPTGVTRPKDGRNAVAIVQAEVQSAAAGGKYVKPKLV
jgi:predicted dehydrogenase